MEYLKQEGFSLKLLLLRPYYGVSIHSEMQGDLGFCSFRQSAFPDISFIYAATIASQNKAIELHVIEANVEQLFPKDILARLKKDYDYIVIKASAPTITYDIEFTRLLKNIIPQAKIVFSGHIAKILKKWIQNNVPEIDEIVEVPIEYYINQLINGNSINLNDLPSPDYTLFPYKKFTDVGGKPLGFIYMSRGCLIGCTYCPYSAFYENKIEVRSLQKVIFDIKNLLELGIDNIQFRDQNFTLNKKTVSDLCRMIIGQKLKFKWRCETRIDTLDKDLIDLMAEAGLDMIFFGIESASNETLHYFNRPTFDLKRAKELIEYLNQKNIITMAFYMIGFPDDTWDSIKRTYDLAVSLGSQVVKFSIFTPFVTNIKYNDEIDIKEITPDHFISLDSTMNIKVSKHFTLEELNYLVYQLTAMYQIEKSGLRDSYYNWYIQYQYTLEAAQKMRNRLKSTPILEL
jgi:radical SAM superfamily enzyme YgiQ (UPF0313 family)